MEKRRGVDSRLLDCDWEEGCRDLDMLALDPSSIKLFWLKEPIKELIDRFIDLERN